MKNIILILILTSFVSINLSFANCYSLWMVDFDRIMEQHERDMARCRDSMVPSYCYAEADAWWTSEINYAGDKFYACT